MKRIFYCVVFFFCFGGLLNFYFSYSSKRIVFQSLWYGKNSNVFDKKNIVISSAAEFQSAWKKLSQTDFAMAATAPEVDFKIKKIIICYAGDQTNGLQIDSTTASNSVLTIHERNISLGSRCYEAALLVTPFEIIEVSAQGWKTVQEESRVKIEDCE